MNSAGYLMSYGWVQGTPLKSGGLRKPILVKHKKDTKGLGHNSDDQEAWWERMFDGQLKALDVMSEDSSSVSFKQKEGTASGVSKNVSPLYKMFVPGGILEGSITKDLLEKSSKKPKSKSKKSEGRVKKSQKKDKSVKSKSKKSKSSKIVNEEEDWIKRMVRESSKSISA